MGIDEGLSILDQVGDGGGVNRVEHRPYPENLTGGLMFPILALLLATGCGSKDGETTTAPAQAAVKPTTPGDANSDRFAMDLVGLSLSNIRPMSAGSARFVYDTLDFQPDNTWQGVGYIEIAGERMDCTESGTWSMEPAESSSVAVMIWTVQSTDCINQTEGDRRYRVTISGGSISLEYR